MAPGEEATVDNLGMSFSPFIILMTCVIVRIASKHNVYFHDKIRKNKSLNICFLDLSEDFRWDSKTSYGTRVVGA